MEKYQFYKSIRDVISIRKMQTILGQLLNEISCSANETGAQTSGLIRESQKRLMEYKEIHLHRVELDGYELNRAYKAMSGTEKHIADMGMAELTYIIDQLDREISGFNSAK